MSSDPLDQRENSPSSISPSHIAIKPIESAVEIGSGIISTLAWYVSTYQS